MLTFATDDPVAGEWTVTCATGAGGSNDLASYAGISCPFNFHSEIFRLLWMRKTWCVYAASRRFRLIKYGYQNPRALRQCHVRGKFHFSIDDGGFVGSAAHPKFT